MFGNVNGSSKSMEILAGTLLKGLGITEEWLREKAEAFLTFVRDIRDNTAVTRQNSETIMSQNAEIIRRLDARDNVREIEHARETDGGGKLPGHAGDPGRVGRGRAGGAAHGRSGGAHGADQGE